MHAFNVQDAQLPQR